MSLPSPPLHFPSIVNLTEPNPDPIQDGKPYILYMAAGITADPARSRGYTVVARSEFASVEDMHWYDEQCPAHAALKETARALGMPEPPLVFYHEDTPLVDRR